MTKENLDLERTRSELGQPLPKKSDQRIKKTEKQNQNAACEKTTSEKEKFGSINKPGL